MHFFRAGRLRGISRALTEWFPTPALLLPPAAGIDISDASVKWLVLSSHGSAHRISTFGEEPLPPGVVESGMIRNVEALAEVLTKVKMHLGKAACAHAALPEEAAYVFSMHLPHGTSRKQAMSMIEFEFEGRVPITPAAAVFDYDVIDTGPEGEEISVAVFPRDLAESYVAAFERAEITLVSLEIEARSIARAVSTGLPDEPITLLVDFGRARTGFAVLKRGIPIFTSTVEVGGDGISRALMEKLSLSPEAAVEFRNEQGLLPGPSNAAPTNDIILPFANALADEVARHYHYWDTRRNEHGERVTPVGKVILVGGSANLKGLDDFIAGKVQAPTTVGDVWHRFLRFDEYVPPIDRRSSLQYATAAGLALRSIV